MNTLPPQLPRPDGPGPVAPQVVTALRDRIVQGALVPGTRLSEQEIATQYDISRQPVREAFIRLAVEGLVEVRPQRGTFVSRINLGFVRDTRFIREAVEADIVRIAARQATADQIADLARQLQAQADLPDGLGLELMRLDENFHATLARAAGKLHVWDKLQGLKIHLDRVRHLTTATVPKSVMLDQHRDVLDAIASGDPDAAETAMRRHLRKVLDDLPGIVAVASQYFDLDSDPQNP
ncbi:GntR family transcriptional regulator [Paracoccus pacificus]|uniref:GntR family transcriptional regulator n=1 Tax=Paracoccus pacificus TaxID=1463598 RepID=A0ABW4R2L0_9RHOB